MRDTENTLFIGNIYEVNRSAAEQAARETNMPIVIKDKATDAWGNILLDCMAVYATSKVDYGKFWRRFKELKLTV